MAKTRIAFVCTQCGASHARWAGKCDACGQWNTIVEESAAGGVGAGPANLRAPREWRCRDLPPPGRCRPAARR